MLLRVSREASEETITTFFVPNKGRSKIEEIIMVETKVLIRKLCLNSEIAARLIELNKVVPRSLNAQASLTLADVRAISQWIV